MRYCVTAMLSSAVSDQLRVSPELVMLAAVREVPTPAHVGTSPAITVTVHVASRPPSCVVTVTSVVPMTRAVTVLPSRFPVSSATVPSEVAQVTVLLLAFAWRQA